MHLDSKFEKETESRPPSENLRTTVRWLYVSLALIFGGGFGAHLVQTNAGKVSVLGFKIPTENGQWLAADLFKPDTASATNRVPVVVVCPGFQRTKETTTGYSIELARRGMTVIVIDPYNQGASSSTRERRSASVEGYGVVPMVEYIHGTPNLNYVDKSRIGAVGYSAGGNAVLQSASGFGEQEAKALRRATSKKSDDGETITEAELEHARSMNKIHSVFVGGYVLSMSSNVLKTVNANVGMDYALHDEGAYRLELQNAGMNNAPEALRLVNSIFQDSEKVSEVEAGRVYGDPSNRTMRVVHNVPNIHPTLPYARAHIAHMTDFFVSAFGMTGVAPGNKQVWQFKEFFTLLSLVGGLSFLVAAAALLLRLPIFSSLRKAVPPPLAAPDLRGKIIFWSLFAFSAVAACYIFVPMARASWVLFPEATNRIQTWWFPQRINNAILLWAVANGILGLGLFFLTSWLKKRKHIAEPAMLGLKTSPRELALTGGLALTVVVAFYGLLFLCYGLFHADFRFVFVSAGTSFQPKMLLVALEYIPAFMIFYFANSVRVNCGSRFEGQKEWVSLLINALGNSVGLMMILAIQYTHFFATGTVFWTEEWLYINLLFGVIPMMILLPLFHRWFFLLTGRVYLGPMITCPVFIMMMLTSNVSYIPLE